MNQLNASGEPPLHYATRKGSKVITYFDIYIYIFICMNVLSGYPNNNNRKWQSCSFNMEPIQTSPGNMVSYLTLIPIIIIIIIINLILVVDVHSHSYSYSRTHTFAYLLFYDIIIIYVLLLSPSTHTYGR